MKGLLLPLLLSLVVCTTMSAQQVFEVRIQETDLDGETPISSDDVEQINNEIDKLFDDDLDAGWEGDELNTLAIGLRFRDIMIPQGATIDSAFIKVFSHEDEGDPALITIYGEAADDTETFNETDLVTDRPATNASVFWEASEPWVIWTEYQTPDIGVIIQEIISRPGWQMGNALTIIMEGEDQGANDEDNARDMESFENVEDPDDGGDGLNHPERIPQLVVYFDGATSTNNLELKSLIEVYPNPVSQGELTIAHKATDVEDLALNLYNIAGELVKVLDTDLQAGEVRTFDVSDLPKGFYLLKATDAQFTDAQKIIIE